MPCTLIMQDGQTVDIDDTVLEAKRRQALGGWQSFKTTDANRCKVDTSKIDKVKALRQ
jgi:hypothetical protein